MSPARKDTGSEVPDARSRRREIGRMVARARLYGLFALILAAVGALLFAYVYFGVYEGDIQASGAGFSLILICLVHFAPAAVLAFLGRLEDRRAKALLAALQK